MSTTHNTATSVVIKVRIVFHRLQLAKRFAQADGRDSITLADLAEADRYTPPSVGSDEEGGVA